MRPSPATLLIATMFGSFAIVLAVMIILFHPGPRTAARRSATIEAQKRSVPPVEPARQDSVISVSASPIQTSTGSVATSAEEPPNVKSPPAAPRPAPVPGRRIRKRLEQDQKELALLRIEMQRRLEEHLATRERKLDMFVGRCKKLEPGEAAEILELLGDDEIAEVLGRLDRETALKIAAFLKILGREDPVPFR